MNPPGESDRRNWKLLWRALGYHFRDKQLAMQALRHGSCAREPGAPSYNRLAFIGDSIIYEMVTVKICAALPDQRLNRLHPLRAVLTSNDRLADVGLDIGLDGYIEAASEVAHRTRRDRYVIASVTEAVIGAMCQEGYQGRAAAEKLLEQHLYCDLEGDFGSEIRNHVIKERLAFWVKKKLGGTQPEYELLGDSAGSDIKIVAVFVRGFVLGIGSSPSRIIAERIAAVRALHKVTEMLNNASPDEPADTAGISLVAARNHVGQMRRRSVIRVDAHN